MDLWLEQHCRFCPVHSSYLIVADFIKLLNSITSTTCDVLSLCRLTFFFHVQAAEETGRKLKVYAVEKNPNAVVTLHVSHIF